MWNSTRGLAPFLLQTENSHLLDTSPIRGPQDGTFTAFSFHFRDLQWQNPHPFSPRAFTSSLLVPQKPRIWVTSPLKPNSPGAPNLEVPSHSHTPQDPHTLPLYRVWQWAAVNTQCGEMRKAPQLKRPRSKRATCHGCEWGAHSSPSSTLSPS